MKDTTLMTSIVEEKALAGDGVAVIRFNPSGDNWARALVNAVVGRYEAVTGTKSPSDEQLRELVGEKVTLIRRGENMLGGPLLSATEGRLFEAPGGVLAIKPKGAQKRGSRVQPAAVLDALGGWDVPAAQRRVDAVRDTLPRLSPLTQERLDELPSAAVRATFCSLAVWGTYRLPDAVAVDALWLIGSYDREVDVVDDSVLLLRPEDGVSEHGSVWGRLLLRGEVGVVEGFEPIAFAEAIELCDRDYDEAVAVALGTRTLTGGGR